MHLTGQLIPESEGAGEIRENVKAHWLKEQRRKKAALVIIISKKKKLIGFWADTYLGASHRMLN